MYIKIRSELGKEEGSSSKKAEKRKILCNNGSSCLKLLMLFYSRLI